jgi:hypothetical protein
VRVELLPPTTSFPNLSKVRAAELLGLGKQPLVNLQVMGLLPDLRVDRVAALAARPWVTADAGLAVVRPGRPDTADDGRLMGMHTSYSDYQVVEATRKWFVAPVDAVLAGQHLLVSASTFLVAWLNVTGLEATRDVQTERGTTVRRNAFETRLLARVDDLVAGVVLQIADVPDALAPLVAALGQRVPSPAGAPLLVPPPFTGPAAAGGARAADSADG